MESFQFYQPTRILFGAGKLNELPDQLRRFGASCLLVTTDAKEAALQPLYQRVLSLLKANGIKVVHFDKVVPNPTIESIEAAITLVQTEKLEVILAVGGGSSIDTAKSIALFGHTNHPKWPEIFEKYTSPFESYELPGPTVLPVIAVPTTAGTGSEVTQAMVISDPAHDDKVCIFHPGAFPRLSIVDPELTLTLPPYMTAVTGFDAFTHAFESFLRETASPYTRLLGREAMQTIIRTLPRLVKEPNWKDGRAEMARAAVFSGISLCNSGATIPHPLSELVGGFNPRISHGQCLASIYPAFLRYQVSQTPEKCAEIAVFFKPELKGKTTEEAASELPWLVTEFIKTIGLHKYFNELGLTSEQFEQIRNHFVLGVLPFAPKEALQKILDESFSRKAE